MGFNRNIMGCKGNKDFEELKDSVGFNRNIMGCKDEPT